MNSNNRKLRRTVLCMALGLGLASLAVPAAFAGSNDGSVVGHTAAGAVITVNNTATGFTLWSHTYDRELADVFDTQSDIAEEVVHALLGVIPGE